MIKAFKIEFPLLLEEDDYYIFEYIFEHRDMKNISIFEDLVKVMLSFGIREHKPRSKKHLNYETLDLKSKRILNRLSNYLAIKELEFDDFFKDMYFTQQVKTKTKSEKVDIMKA